MEDMCLARSLYWATTYFDSSSSLALNMQNLRSLQQIVDKAIEWERRGGVIFKSAKTVMIHFTKLVDKDSEESIQVKDQTVDPHKAIKILGMILDQRLSMEAQYILKWNKL